MDAIMSAIGVLLIQAGIVLVFFGFIILIVAHKED